MTNQFELIGRVLGQIALVLVACRLVGLGLRRLGQTQVVADMVAGFLLGPSLLGALAPQLQHWLFPTHVAGSTSVVDPSLTAIYVLGQLGLVVYMFVVGLTFDIATFTRHVRQSVLVSVAGVLTPTMFGAAIGWSLVSGHPGFFGGNVSAWQGALFTGTAMSVSAFPMLARIIHESGLARTRLGTMALASAAGDDLAAWALLAVVVASTQHDPWHAVVAVLGAGLFVAVMIVGLRPLAAWLVGRRAERFDSDVLVLTSVFVLACACLTESIGVYSVFGAFVAGAIMPRGAFANWVCERMEPLAATVLLPMFFVYSGLNAHLDLLLKPTVLAVCAVVTVAAFVGKGGAAYLAARASGMSTTDAAALGALLNARGLMELILVNIGLAAGIVTPQLYTVLVVMTILTTLASSPVYALTRRIALRRAIDVEQAEPERVADELRPVTAAGLGQQVVHVGLDGGA
jgi:Kef-type K+ transport system membrane component KefB